MLFNTMRKKKVEEMIEPSPVSPHYGLQTWLNRPNGEPEHPLFPDRAPHSAFSLIGHMGQYVFVSPAQGLKRWLSGTLRRNTLS